MKKLDLLLKNKKILILGFGREGQSTYQFLRALYPHVHLGIADKSESLESTFSQTFRDKNISFHSGEMYLDSIANYEVVIRTPGINYKFPEILKAKEKGIIFTSQTEIFLNNVSGKLVGITGTKGKSTTSSLTYHILKESGHNVYLLGNIGFPCLDYLSKDSKDTIFVFEMSCHQLATLEVSPHVAVFLNIFPEHLDYYNSFEDYFNAKATITKYQTNEDHFIYNSNFTEIKRLADSTKAKKYTFGDNKKSEIYSDGNHIMIGSEKLINHSDVSLKGTHNINNVVASSLVSKIIGVPHNKIASAIKTFTPLEGRLETIRVINGVTFVNDTLSTIPESAIEAMKAFPNQNILPILGGFDRNIDFSKLADFIAHQNNITTVILIGSVSEKIEKELLNYRYTGKIINLGIKSSMRDIVKTAFESVIQNSVVLLSPAATSFDMFKDYKDRGDQFREAVDKLYV